jgi:hypothetical protein
MLVRSKFSRNRRVASGFTSDHGAAQPSECGAELGVRNLVQPLVESPRLAGLQRAECWPARRRGERQRSLHQRKSGYDWTPEEQIEPFDDQRCAVLQLDSRYRESAKLENTVAAERGRPRDTGPVGADDLRPLRLEADQNPTAVPGNDWSRKL